MRESPARRGASPEVARCHLAVLTGPDRGRDLVVTGDLCRAGKAPDNDLVLEDETVSRYHFELVREPRGWLLRDTGSTNGTQLDGAEIREAFLKTLSVVTAGTVQVRARTWTETIEPAAVDGDRFGDAIGGSKVMRELFGALGRVAPTETSVVLAGERGTGRALLARALHAASPRAARPFVKVDCAQSPAVLEAELFGNERAGGAVARFGVLEAAAGGTVLLEEVGSLPLDLQPKLQRALAERQVRRAGSVRPVRIDIRVVATAPADILAEVERGRFGRELLFRLGVVLPVPALRERGEDVVRLARSFAAKHGAASPLADRALAALAEHDWPGNVPELAAVVSRLAGGLDPAVAPGPRRSFEPGRSFRAEKERWEGDFERAYVDWLLERNQGNISQAAREAQMDRKYLHKLMRRHGLDSRGRRG